MALSPKDKRLLRLAVGICLADWALVDRIRREAPPGEPDRNWREAVLQTHLFAGFPRMVEACEVLAQGGGLGVPDASEFPTEVERREEGRRLFGQVYDDQAERVRATLSEFHPSLERWVLDHAYGRVLSRPGLSPDRRELAAVACLAALGQERQLASHVRGAVRVGATEGEVRDTLDLIADQVDPRLLDRAGRVVGRFLPRS